MREVLTEREDRSFGRIRIRPATECTSEESDRSVADAGPLRAARHYKIISSVSPAHRYALEIATLAKAECPNQHVEQRAVRRAAR